MRIYEELFIIRPDAPEEEIDAYIEQIKELIIKSGGTVEKADKWGVRKLAYRVDKRSEGFYVLVQFTADATAVKEIERRMRVTDMVIKWITVRIDEKLKKLEKRTKQREKRAKRRPAPAERSPIPASPMFPAAPAPGGPTPGAPAPGAPVLAAPPLDVVETADAAPVVEAPAAETQE
jgi:small subunit ribosomal protein S6